MGEHSYIVLKPGLSEPFLFFDHVEVASEPFIAKDWVVYNETQDPIGGPEVVETLYNI
jgi:hypothetical protein